MVRGIGLICIANILIYTGPKICGELQFMQRVDVGKVEVPEAVTGSDKVPFPAGLKQRWKPFGWSKGSYS